MKHIWLIIILIISCNSDAYFMNLCKMNDAIISKPEILHCLKNGNNLGCLVNHKIMDNHPLDTIIYMSEGKDMHSFSLAYRKPSTSNSYLFYVYVNIPNEMKIYEAFEQISDGRSSIRKINNHWFICKLFKKFN